MYVFARKSVHVKFNLLCLAKKHGSAGTPFHRQPAIKLDFYTNTTEQYLQTKILMPLKGITCCLQFRRNQKFYYFSVAIGDSGKKTRGKSRETLKF